MMHPTLLHTRSRHARAALVGVLVLGAAPAFAGEFSPPEFSLGLGCAMEALTFSPSETQPYTVMISPGVSGFTDSHPQNFVRVRSVSGLFETTQDANDQYNYIAAAKFATVAELKSALSDPAGWTLEITDGATGFVYNFTFTLDAGGFPAEYLRPITFTNVTPGSVISANPTFTWSQPSTTNPGALEDTAFNQLYSDDFANIYTSPSISPLDSSWTPTGPLARNRYTLFIGKLNNSVNQSFVTATIVNGTSGDAVLYDIFPFTSARAFSYCPMLTVSCPGDLNGDGAINTTDLTRFLSQFGRPCSQITGLCADFDNDGTITTSDLTFLLVRFGGQCP